MVVRRFSAAFALPFIFGGFSPSLKADAIKINGF